MKAIAFRLSEDDRRKLKEMAKKAGKSQSELFRWWIEKTHAVMFGVPDQEAK